MVLIGNVVGIEVGNKLLCFKWGFLLIFVGFGEF